MTVRWTDECASSMVPNARASTDPEESYPIF